MLLPRLFSAIALVPVIAGAQVVLPLKHKPVRPYKAGDHGGRSDDAVVHLRR